MRIKPLPKLVLILAVVGAAAFGISKFMDSKTYKNIVTSAPAKSTPAAPTPSAPVAVTGEIGTNDLPLVVSLVSFHGYAPALLANGKSLTTQAGSIYNQKGLNVTFKIQDDVPTLATLFESGQAHCAWRTSDFWAQEQPNLRNAKLDGKAVMVVDNTQGGDAIIAKDPAIKSIEDLANKKVALLQFTPSHGLIINGIENSSLTARNKQSVQFVFIQAEEGTGGVRAAYESGKVDAAVLWDPDLSLALRAGGHVVYSTKLATNLIFDVMVCDTRVLNNPAGKVAVQKFVDGWLAGVTAARANPNDAVDALVQTEPMFKQLVDKEGAPFVVSLFKNLVWTDLADNARILGQAGGTNHYERVYKEFDVIYRAAGALANPNSPVVNPSDSFDYSFVKTLLSGNNNALNAAAKPTNTFTSAGLSTAAGLGAAVTKPVYVKFETGSAELNQRSKKTIDTDMVPFIENNGSAYIEVSGNADSTGSAGKNQSLSAIRAKVVVDYLVKEWQFPVARFKTVGNGSDRPICNEQNPSGEGMNLEDCRAMNRTTRLGILR